MVLKGIEQPAAEALEALLGELGQETAWQPGDDPPDLVFRVGSERWAVEVTELHQYFDRGGVEEARIASDKQLIGMCREVQGRVADLRNRNYLISANGPVSKPERARIAAEAERYIRSGETAEHQLDDGGAVRIRALQRAIRIDFIVGLEIEAVVPGTGQSVASLNASVGHAVDRILREKLPTLRRLAGYDRKMLLIWSQNVFADPDEIRELLSQRDLQGVDTILLVYDGRVHWVADPSQVFIPQ